MLSQELKIDDDTIVIFSGDNGPEETIPWRGWAGPWTGTYVTAMEGSLRVPFIVRWPGRVRGRPSERRDVHITDLYTTLAKLGGARSPAIAPSTAWMKARSCSANRRNRRVSGSLSSSRAVLAGAELYAMKWRNYKLHLIWQEREFDAPQRALGPSPHRPLR